MKETNEPLISKQKLVEIIKTYFDLREIADLCFQLEVDYDEIKGDTKSEKARELATYMERRGQLDRLYRMVLLLRPHIGINLGRLLSESFSANDPKLKGAQSLLGQLRQHYEKLNEWKELHNHLDEIINVFSQFSAQIRRLADDGKPVEDMEMLKDSWDPVRRRVSKLLQWAEDDLKHIGRRYGVTESGERTGEKWAVTLGQQHEAIVMLLAESPLQTEIKSSNEVLRRFTNFMGSRGSNQSAWRGWWGTLRENTRAFDDHLRDHMFLADKELRKTAVELHEFSKETLWG